MDSQGTQISDLPGHAPNVSEAFLKDITTKDNSRKEIASIGGNLSKYGFPDFQLKGFTQGEQTGSVTERLRKDIQESITVSNLQQTTLEYVNDLERRHLPAAELNKTMEQVCRLLEATDGATARSQRRLAAIDLLYNVAHPETISQGRHGTCSVAALEYKMYLQHPSVAAEMVASAALTGSWKGKDGKMISIPAEALGTGEIERKHYPPRDGERSYASQLFQVAALNDVGQHLKSPMKFVQYAQPTFVDGGQSLEHDFWILPNGTKKPFEEPGRGDFSRTGGLTSFEIAAEITRLTGETNGVIANREHDRDDTPTENAPYPGIKGDNLTDVRSQREFESAIVQLKHDGKLPVVISVYGQGIKDLDGSSAVQGEAPNHFVCIDDYQPASGGQAARLHVHNNWRQENNGWMNLRDFYQSLT
jgi:hypothetical protein